LTWLGDVAMTAPFNHSLGYPSQNKMGDYYDMVSDNQGVNLAFSATFTGGQDVYYMRITAVPEPATPLVLMFGLLLQGLRRRRASNFAV
jgi:hypothetical protein